MQKSGTEMHADIVDHISTDGDDGVVAALEFAGVTVVVVRDQGFAGVKVDNEALVNAIKESLEIVAL